MRYTRLRKAFEEGTLVGAHGLPYQSDKLEDQQKKRKQGFGKGKGIDGSDGGAKGYEWDMIEKPHDRKWRPGSHAGDPAGRRVLQDSAVVDPDDSDDQKPLMKKWKKEHVAESHPAWFKSEPPHDSGAEMSDGKDRKEEILEQEQVPMPACEGVDWVYPAPSHVDHSVPAIPSTEIKPDVTTEEEDKTHLLIKTSAERSTLF